MSHYRNPYIAEETPHHQNRYRPVYPYGEVSGTPPMGYRQPEHHSYRREQPDHHQSYRQVLEPQGYRQPEQQRLLYADDDIAYPRESPRMSTLRTPHHHQQHPGPYHHLGRSETLPMHHLDSLGRRMPTSTTPRRKVGELDLGVGHMDQREALLRSTPPTLRRGDPGPVKLAPGWESRNAPHDELNFRNVRSAGPKGTPANNEDDDISDKPPIDRCNVVYLILMLHGIGTLMPWNMFINANSYFVEYKLAVNSTDGATENYSKNFLSYVGMASQLPNVICNALNLFVQIGGGNVTFRIVTSILVEVVIFILTVVLAMIDTASWAGIFFYVTLASVAILNMASGVYQSSIFGLAAKLPMRYTNAIIFGANISGVITSSINIFTIFASPNLRTAAIYYFLTALFFLLTCFDTYFALPFSRYYRYYHRLAKKAAISGGSQGHSGRPPYWKIFKKTWPQCFNVFFIFFVTLSIFPAVQANVVAFDSNFILTPKYFTSVACFLNFNLFAMIGNIFPNWIRFPGPRFLWLPVLLRALLIPFFMLCNYNPDKRVLPVLIDQDWAFIGVGAFLGLTSGYFSSLAMMYAPKCVAPQHAPYAGMMASLFLILGIFAGVNFSMFISWLVETRLF